MVSIPFQNRLLYVLPFGTMIVNVVGCFLIGCLFSLFLKDMFSHEWKIFLVTGVLGGFTTFSSFSIETVEMFREGATTKAILYIFLSVAAGILATLGGIYLFKN